MTRDDAARVLYLVNDQMPTTKADLRAAQGHRRTTTSAARTFSLGAILGGAIGVLLGVAIRRLTFEGILLDRRLDDALARNFHGEQGL